MKFSHKLASVSLASQLASLTLGRPKSHVYKRQNVGLPNGPKIDNADLPYDPAGPVSASGNIYGGTGLLGAAGDTATAVEIGLGVPAPTGSTAGYVGDYALAPGQEANADLGIFIDLSNNPIPQPIRGGNGATDPGPKNEAEQRQNPDLLARPGTDSGDIANLKWPNGPFQHPVRHWRWKTRLGKAAEYR